MIIIKAIAPNMPAKKYPKTGMKQETTVRIMQVIAAVVAVPRVFKVGAAGANGSGEGEWVGDAGGKDAFILMECPILRSSPNISDNPCSSALIFNPILAPGAEIEVAQF